MSARNFVATKSFWSSDKDGVASLVKVGERFAEGHPSVEANPQYFDSDESVTDAPGKRGPGRPPKSE